MGRLYSLVSTSWPAEPILLIKVDYVRAFRDSLTNITSPESKEPNPINVLPLLLCKWFKVWCLAVYIVSTIRYKMFDCNCAWCYQVSGNWYLVLAFNLHPLHLLSMGWVKKKKYYWSGAGLKFEIGNSMSTKGFFMISQLAIDLPVLLHSLFIKRICKLNITLS